MRFKEIICRLTGLSIPVFGVSWNPPEADVARARRVVTYLEDRRVLYNPSDLEVPEHCVQSVLEIRQFLTAELAGAGGDSPLDRSLRAMRAACRKFLDQVQARGPDLVTFAWQRGHWASWEFNAALGELRGVFGVHLAQIAGQHGLDVEDDLARILPGEDEGQRNRALRPAAPAKRKRRA
jgi:hypothetical protein